MDAETQNLVKREVLLIIEGQVKDRVELCVDAAVRAQLAAIVNDEVSKCIGKAIGNYVTAFLRKNATL